MHVASAIERRPDCETELSIHITWRQYFMHIRSLLNGLNPSCRRGRRGAVAGGSRGGKVNASNCMRLGHVNVRDSGSEPAFCCSASTQTCVSQPLRPATLRVPAVAPPCRRRVQRRRGPSDVCASFGRPAWRRGISTNITHADTALPTAGPGAGAAQRSCGYMPGVSPCHTYVAMLILYFDRVILFHIL